MRKRLLRGWGTALALLTLGACLWLSGEMLRRDGGRVEVTSVAFLQGRGTLYRSRETGVAPGDRCAAALILSGGMDGANALAVELARRDVAALVVKGDTPAAAAWEYLTEQVFTDPGAMGLFAAQSRAGEALDLGDALAGPEGACAGVVVLAGEDLAERAGAFTGRNLLFLTRTLSDRGRRAFFGLEMDPRRVINGYFGEGTARCAEALGGPGLDFTREDVMSRTLDWQGSCLGHASGLADDDLVYPTAMFSRWAALGCLLAAGVTICLRLRRRNRKVANTL